MSRNVLIATLHVKSLRDSNGASAKTVSKVVRPHHNRRHFWKGTHMGTTLWRQRHWTARVQLAVGSQFGITW